EKKTAQNNAATAVASGHFAATQQAIAEDNAAQALAKENEAKAQRSAAQASIYVDRPGELDTSSLLALDSWLRIPSDEAEDVLRNNISEMPIPVAQVKHNGRIWNLHTSKDGQYIVSASADKTACIWTKDGKRKFCVQHDLDVTDALLTSDNSLLVTSSMDGTIRLWSGEDGKPIQEFKYDTEILDIDISPDGKLLTAGRKDGFVSVIDLIKHKDIFVINFAAGPVTVLSFQPDGQWLAVGTQHGDVRIWRVMTGLSLIGPKHKGEIFNLAFSPDGKWLVSVGSDSTARVVKTESGGQNRVVEHGDWVEDVAFGSDNSWYATVSDDNLVRIIETQTGQEKLRMQHGSFVQRVEVSTNGQWIVSTGYDHTARVWDAETGALMFEASIDSIGSSLIFSPDGNQIIVGDRDGNITIWDISTLKARVGYIEFPEFVNKAKYDPAGNWLIVNSDDKNLWQIPADQLTSIHDGTLGTKVFTFDDITSQLKVSPNSKWIAVSENSETATSKALLYNLETKTLYSLNQSSDVIGLAISADSKFLAVTDQGNSHVYIWDIESGQQINAIEFSEAAFTSAFSPKDHILAIGLADKTVLWDTVANKQIATLQQVGSIKSITFNKEGNWLATTSSDGSIYVWDMAKNNYVEPLFTFLQGGRITSLDFNPKKQWLASAGSNGFVYLWNLETGEEIVRIHHVDSVSGINFSADGNYLSTVTRKVVQIWDVNQFVPITKDKLAETVCSRLVTNLTKSQWQFFFHEEEYHVLCPNLP
ncbi:MAG: WD40 repeat domain-containing protein, partial [Anaerolineales bacterium]